jgi:ABC-type nitrate/sulfonate/bicarbonate transport system substrate-binding protein
MNVAVAKPIRSEALQIGAREAYYTICPVFVASNVALELGWLEQELKEIGAKLSYLRSLPEAVGWLPHYSHGFEHLFRDGGNIPSIWSKAENKDTKLIGLTAARDGGRIVVRADSKLHRVRDLKGRRFGLFKSLNAAKVDWWRATSERGILQALALAGLSRDDVEVLDIDHVESRGFGRASRPSDLWWRRRREEPHFTSEVAALEESRVEAIYASEGRALALERTGRFKTIEDLARYPDWTLQVANSPYAITVNTDFAEQNRDIVVAYLRAVLRAGHWINANRPAAAAILAGVTDYPGAADVAKAIVDTDFVPNLSDQNLAGIEIESAFLKKHGYIGRDFDVQQWADASFLKEAIASL